MKSLSDCYILKNGVKIPCIGYGTWQTPDGETAKSSVKYALECGYRHIDTAAGYGNEKSVGEGIKASGIKREEFFVTTKHWITDRGYEKTIAAAEKSISALGLDYIDLYLIHWPAVEKTFKDWKEINASTWRGFEKLYKDGKIKAIGVSNFLPRHIEALLENAEIPPMVNQIEFHPGYTQPEVVKWCKQRSILIEAWSPLGCGKVLGDKILGVIAEKYGKSTAQLCIRYALQHGVLPLPKSVTPERIKENAKVFDFEITAADMEEIDAIPKLGYSGYYPEDAPADALI
ncbi:MAG: oxidoreductase [Clostridia bacterium]|nr:oxidoreductase [Clostridia bacterium]